MLRIVWLISLSILFFGCASKSDLSNSKNTEKICTNKTVEETYHLLYDNMKLHHFGSVDKSKEKNYSYVGTSTVAMEGSHLIETKMISANHYQIIRSVQGGFAPRMYGELIDISKGNSKCRTEVRLKYMNSIWKYRFSDLIKKWLKL